MKKSQRLGSILDLAENREKDAARAFGKLRQMVESHRGTLESLQGFRNSYTERFRQSGETGISVQQMLEYRVFLEKIGGVIQEQEQVLARAELELERARRAWESAHRHTLGMQKLVDTARGDELRRDARREQAEMDERAGRKAVTSDRLPE
ncbi:MAG TPA: flagellar export protein FliJ [Methylococcaceae bacterium]|nr:flagellar export protein FliJ [Methylococcaceae bacterium]